MTYEMQALPSSTVSLRMLLAAACAEGESVLENISDAADVSSLVACLRSVGVSAEWEGAGIIRVKGCRAQGGTSGAPVECGYGRSADTFRLLSPMLAAGKGTFRLIGASAAEELPADSLADALSQQGSLLSADGGSNGFSLSAAGLSGGDVAVSIEQSSQYVSGLLLAAPLAQNQTSLFLSGQVVTTWAYIGLTLQIMKTFGVRFDICTRTGPSGGWWPADWGKMREAVPGLVRLRVRPSEYKAGRYRAEGSWASSVFSLLAGALGRESVSVIGLRKDSVQPEAYILKLLRDMGARIEWERRGSELAVTVHPADLHSLNADLSFCPEIVPAAAVLAAFADGESTIGAASLAEGEAAPLARAAKLLDSAGITYAMEDGKLTVFGKSGGEQEEGERLNLSGREVRIAPGETPQAAALSALFSFAGADVVWSEDDAEGDAAFGDLTGTVRRLCSD